MDFQVHLQIIESKFSSKLKDLKHLVVCCEVSLDSRTFSTETVKLNSKLVMTLEKGSSTLQLSIGKRKRDHSISPIGISAIIIDQLKNKYFTAIVYSTENTGTCIGKLSCKSRIKTLTEPSAEEDDNLMHILPDFRFSPLTREIDWNRLQNLDMKRMSLLGDTRKLNALRGDILLGDFSDEDADQRLLKCLSLAQYSTQYLDSCTTFLEGRKKVISAALDSFEQEEELLDLHISKLRARAKALQREIHFVDEIHQSYVSNLRALQPDVDLSRAEEDRPLPLPVVGPSHPSREDPSPAINEAPVGQAVALSSGDSDSADEADEIELPKQLEHMYVPSPRAQTSVKPGAWAQATVAGAEQPANPASGWAPAVRKLEAKQVDSVATAPPALDSSPGSSIYQSLARLATENQNLMSTASTQPSLAMSFDSLELTGTQDRLSPSTVPRMDGGGDGVPLFQLLPRKEHIPVEILEEIKIPEFHGSKSLASTAMSLDSLSPSVTEVKLDEPELEESFYGDNDRPESPTMEVVRRNSIKAQSDALRAALRRSRDSDDDEDIEAEDLIEDDRKPVIRNEYLERKHQLADYEDDEEAEEKSEQSAEEKSMASVDKFELEESESMSADYIPSFARAKVIDNAGIRSGVLHYLHNEGNPSIHDSSESPPKFASRIEDGEEDDVLMGTSRIQLNLTSTIEDSNDESFGDLILAEEDDTYSPLVWQEGVANMDLIDVGHAIQLTLQSIQFHEKRPREDLQVQVQFLGTKLTTFQCPDGGDSLVTHLHLDRSSIGLLRSARKKSSSAALEIGLRFISKGKFIGSATVDLSCMVEEARSVTMQEVQIESSSTLVDTSLGIAIVDVDGYQALESV